MMKKRQYFLIGMVAIFVLTLGGMLYATRFANDRASDVLSNRAYQNTVIVDAGHGGEDGGAVGIDGTAEKDINLDIALKLEKILKLYGINVIMTRTQDVMTCDEGLSTLRERKVSDIHNRFALIEENPKSLFVSIHQNKFEDSKQNGMQVFYSGNNAESKSLAQSIQNSVVSKLQPNNKRVVKRSGSGIYLLYHAKSPAVLVECGFISNPDEIKKLNDDAYRMKTAILVADGILKYFMNG